MPYEEANMQKYEQAFIGNSNKKLLDEIAVLKAKIATMSQNIEDLEEENVELSDIAYSVVEEEIEEDMEETVAGANVLLDAYALITGPRQAAYAHPAEDYTKVTDIFHALTGVRLSLEQGIMFMVSIKLARLRTNMDDGRMHWDSLTDAAGYLGCLGMIWTKMNDPWEPYYETEQGE